MVLDIEKIGDRRIAALVDGTIGDPERREVALAVERLDAAAILAAAEHAIEFAGAELAQFVRDGSISPDGLVAGTYLHGIFEQAAPRRALIHALLQARGFTPPSPQSPSPNPYDRLATTLGETLNLTGTRAAALLART